MDALLAVAAGLLAAYVLLLLALVAAGRRSDARAWAGFVPDCAVLCSRLGRDPHVPRAHKVMLAALFLYLASPIDLVPDFVPVAGQLDDAVLLALALRSVARRAGPGVLREHWPGPERSLAVVLRLAGCPTPPPRPSPLT